MDHERLISKHKDAVYRQMVRVCGNHDDAEDVLVEAMLSAYRASSQLQDSDNFRAWLATIGRRACGKLKQREKLHPVLSLSALEASGVSEPVSDLLLQDEQMEVGQLKECIASAVQGLSPEYRDVYRLREIEGHSAEETSKRLDISIPAVKSRLHRARKLVRATLDDSLCR